MSENKEEEEEEGEEQQGYGGWGFSLPSLPIVAPDFSSLTDTISSAVKELESKADEAYEQMKGMTDEAMKNTVMEAERMSKEEEREEVEVREEEEKEKAAREKEEEILNAKREREQKEQKKEEAKKKLEKAKAEKKRKEEEEEEQKEKEQEVKRKEKEKAEAEAAAAKEKEKKKKMEEERERERAAAVGTPPRLPTRRKYYSPEIPAQCLLRQAPRSRARPECHCGGVPRVRLRLPRAPHEGLLRQIKHRPRRLRPAPG